MMSHSAVTMYDYHVWANKTMFGRLKELPSDVYTKEIRSVFPSISKVMPHIYFVDRTWMDTLAGKSMSEALAHANELKEQTEAAGIEELEAMFEELSERYKSFLRGEESLDRTIPLDNPYAGFRETSLAEIILQVVNHGTYHRGNITAMLRQLGHPSTMTEYALYWYSKPEAGAEMLNG